ncbi:hypothetical protein ACLESO_52280 [Pyxidicoccus sp. 3LG]
MRMPRRFFDLFDDVYHPGRWHLGSPVDAQGREVDDSGYGRPNGHVFPAEALVDLFTLLERGGVMTRAR